MEIAQAGNRGKSCDERLREISIVFVEPLYDQNVGYLARCMKNFCFEKLIVVRPRCALGVESIKYAMHAAEIVEAALIVSSFEDVVKSHDFVACSTGVKGSGALRRYLTPRELASLVLEISGRKALVIGREDIGLTREELSSCDVVVTIEANPAYPSLNASHAAAILLYEFFNAATGFGTYKLERPPRDELEAFFRVFRKLSGLLGYDDQRIRNSEIVLRRFLSENRVSRADLRVLFSLIGDSARVIERLLAERQSDSNKQSIREARW